MITIVEKSFIRFYEEGYVEYKIFKPKTILDQRQSFIKIQVITLICYRIARKQTNRLTSYHFYGKDRISYLVDC